MEMRTVGVPLWTVSTAEVSRRIVVKPVKIMYHKGSFILKRNRYRYHSPDS